MQRNQRDVPEHEIYMNVVDAVSRGIRNQFVEEIGDGGLLDDFISMWKEKFMQTKVVEPGVSTTWSGAPRRMTQNQTYNRVEIMSAAHKPPQSSLKDLLNIQVNPGTVKLHYTPIVQPSSVAARPLQPQPVAYCNPNSQDNQLQKLLDMKPLVRSSLTSIPNLQIRVLPPTDQPSNPSQGLKTQIQSLQLPRVVNPQMQSVHGPRVTSQVQGLHQIRPNNPQITNQNMATMLRQGSAPQLFVHHLPQMTSQCRPFNQVQRLPSVPVLPRNAVPQRMPVIVHQGVAYTVQGVPSGLQNIRMFNNATNPSYANPHNFKFTQLDGVAFMDDDDSDDGFDEIDVVTTEDVGDSSVTRSAASEFTGEVINLDSIVMPTKEDVEEKFECDNLIICFYTQLQLKKGKFKIEFKDGIIMAKNKEKIFQVAHGAFT